MAGEKLLLRVEEARQLVDIGRNTFYQLLREQVIPSVKVGKSIRIPRQALLNWIETQTVGGAKAG